MWTSSPAPPRSARPRPALPCSAPPFPAPPGSALQLCTDPSRNLWVVLPGRAQELRTDFCTSLTDVHENCNSTKCFPALRRAVPV